MSLYKFLENTNPLLTIPLTKCSDNLDRKELKENLIETMKESAGVGLSANQCGVMERAFVMYSDVKKKEIYEKMAQAGIGTIIGMHMGEEHRKEAEKYHLNVVIAGHMASDSLGMNLFLDGLVFPPH